MYDVKTLTTPREAKSYEKLTYALYRPYLRQLRRCRNIIALGLHNDGTPVGLAIAYLDASDECAELLSLFIHPAHRNQGLGKTLMMCVENLLMRAGYKRLNLVYIPNATSQALESILIQRRWSPPYPRMLIAMSTVERLAHLPWLGARHRLRQSCELFPWTDLSRYDKRNILQRQCQDPWYPPILDPFKEPESLETLNSLGLRYKDEVAGWMITHRIKADTIRYTSLFVREDLQQLGYAIPLLATAISQQIDDRQVLNTSFAVEVDNSAMQRFVYRRLAPYMTSLRYSMGTSKQLTGGLVCQEEGARPSALDLTVA